MAAVVLNRGHKIIKVKVVRPRSQEKNAGAMHRHADVRPSNLEVLDLEAAPGKLSQHKHQLLQGSMKTTKLHHMHEYTRKLARPRAVCVLLML